MKKGAEQWRSRTARIPAVPVRSNRDAASHEPMKITAVIIAQTPAQPGRVSVCAGIRIARHRGWPDKQSSLLRFVSSSRNRITLNSHLRRVRVSRCFVIWPRWRLASSFPRKRQSRTPQNPRFRLAPPRTVIRAWPERPWKYYVHLRVTSPRSTEFQYFRIGT